MVIEPSTVDVPHNKMAAFTAQLCCSYLCHIGRDLVARQVEVSESSIGKGSEHHLQLQSGQTAEGKVTIAEGVKAGQVGGVQGAVPEEQKCE